MGIGYASSDDFFLKDLDGTVWRMVGRGINGSNDFYPGSQG